MLFMCSLDLKATQWRLIMIQRVIFISKEWSFECYSKEPNLTSVKCKALTECYINIHMAGCYYWKIAELSDLFKRKENII